jgi:hypothetical protein
MAISVLFPSVNSWIVANPDLFTWIFVVINMILRYATKGGIQII